MRVTAEQAAKWVVDMEAGPERSRLWNGHHSRRIETLSDGYSATDHSKADAWLIGEYVAAHGGVCQHDYPDRTLEDTATGFTCKACGEEVLYW